MRVMTCERPMLLLRYRMCHCGEGRREGERRRARERGMESEAPLVAMAEEDDEEEECVLKLLQ